MNVDPLTKLELAFDMIWDNMDASLLKLIPDDLQQKYERDLAGLETARRLGPMHKGGKIGMSKPTVSTRNGNFDSATIADMRKTLEAASDMDRNSVVMWRGQQLVISYGWYLVEYVEGELAKRPSGHGGL